MRISHLGGTDDKKTKPRLAGARSLDDEELNEIDFLGFLMTFLRLFGGLRRDFPADDHARRSPDDTRSKQD